MVDRFLFLKHKLTVRCLNIKKVARPLSQYHKRIFRTDEKLMCPDESGDFEFVMYDIDGTQPYGRGDLFLDPDRTMMDIDFMKSAQQKPAKLDGLFKSGPRIALTAIIAIVLVYAGISTVLAMI